MTSLTSSLIIVVDNANKICHQHERLEKYVRYITPFAKSISSSFAWPSNSDRDHCLRELRMSLALVNSSDNEEMDVEEVDIIADLCQCMIRYLLKDLGATQRMKIKIINEMDKDEISRNALRMIEDVINPSQLPDSPPIYGVPDNLISPSHIVSPFLVEKLDEVKKYLLAPPELFPSPIETEPLSPFQTIFNTIRDGVVSTFSTVVRSLFSKSSEEERAKYTEIGSDSGDSYPDRAQNLEDVAAIDGGCHEFDTDLGKNEDYRQAIFIHTRSDTLGREYCGNLLKDKEFVDQFLHGVCWLSYTEFPSVEEVIEKGREFAREILGKRNIHIQTTNDLERRLEELSSGLSSLIVFDAVKYS